MSAWELVKFALPFGLLSLLPVYIAMKRKPRHRWLIVVAVVISLALLPISIRMGGIGSVWRHGTELLLLWWGPSMMIWLLALICACLDAPSRPPLPRRGFDVLPVSTPPARQ